MRACVAELDEAPEELQESIHEPVLGCLHAPTYRRRARFMSSALLAYHRPSPTRPVTNHCLPPAAFRFTWLGLGSARNQAPVSRL